MMILILLTREDERNERGQNAQNKRDDREDRKDDTLVAERALRERICFFVCFARGKSAVLLDLRLFLSWCYECVGGLKM